VWGSGRKGYDDGKPGRGRRGEEVQASSSHVAVTWRSSIWVMLVNLHVVELGRVRSEMGDGTSIAAENIQRY
jgi:hypothetical protein